MFPTHHETTQWGCVFGVFLIWILTLLPIRIAQTRDTNGLDNSHPREQYAQLNDSGKRAVAANNNTFEALVFFATAVTANTLGGGNKTAGDVLSIIYLVLRAVYPFLYYANFATLRSINFLIGVFCLLGLFINPFATG